MVNFTDIPNKLAELTLDMLMRNCNIQNDESAVVLAKNCDDIMNNINYSNYNNIRSKANLNNNNFKTNSSDIYKIISISKSNLLSNANIQTRLLNRDYGETHSYVNVNKCHHKRFRNCFKNKLTNYKKMRVPVEDIELSKRSVSMNESDEEITSVNITTSNNNLNNVIENKNERTVEFTINKNVEKDNKNSNKFEEMNSIEFKNNRDESIYLDEVRKQFEIYQHGKVRKGVMDIKLTEKEKEDLREYSKEGLQYSDSVKKQNSKIEEEYLLFCKQMNFQPFPLDENNAPSFIHFLGKSGKYNSNSIDKVVRYALFRLNLEKTHLAVSDYVTAKMNAEVNALYKDETVRQPSEGMTPITTDDMKIIIEKIPDIDPEKPRIASLFLFALSTGSRASTCSGVKLCHLIYYYERNDIYNNITLVIKQEVLKNKKIKNKSVSISGNILNKDSLNVIYWLNQYLIKSFKTNVIELVKFNINHPNEKQDFLWPLKPDSMSLILKRRVKQAGLEIEKVGMHSLRSGFLTSATLIHNDNESRLRSSIEKAAIIADWEVYSPAQMRYIKSATKRAIISSDLVGISKTDDNGLQSSLTTSNFHMISIKDPPPSKPLSFVVKNAVREKQGYPPNYNEFNKLYFDSLYNSAINQLGKVLFGNEKLTYSARRSKVIHYIDETIKKNNDAVENISEILNNFINENKKKICGFDDEKQEKPTSYVEKRNNLFSDLAKRKIQKARWSEEEERQFEQGIKEKKSLKEISNSLFFRSYTECYDHLRAINKRRESQGLEKLTVPKSVRKERMKNRNIFDLKKSESNEMNMDSNTNSTYQNHSVTIENNNINIYNDQYIIEYNNINGDNINKYKTNNEINININNINFVNNENNTSLTDNSNSYKNMNNNNNFINNPFNNSSINSNSNRRDNMNIEDNRIYHFSYKVLNEIPNSNIMFLNNPFVFATSIPDYCFQKPFLNNADDDKNQRDNNKFFQDYISGLYSVCQSTPNDNNIYFFNYPSNK